MHIAKAALERTTIKDRAGSGRRIGEVDNTNRLVQRTGEAQPGALIEHAPY
jgi:hypothetical protein